MRIMITESQLNRLLLNETKQEIITDENLDKAKKIVKKLMSVGFTSQESAAIAGNMWAESQFKSDIKSSNGALGLVQWLGDRKRALITYANYKESTWSDENTQIKFLKFELKDSYKLNNGNFLPGLPEDIKLSNEYESKQFSSAMKGETVQKKAEGFATKVERCGGCGGTIGIRKDSAKRIYDYVNGNYTPKTNSGDKKDVSTTYSIGTTVYPNQTDGYANVRKEPKTESDRIAKILSPNKIGKITKSLTDENKKKWFQVSLDKEVNGNKIGWVRSDVLK